MIETVEKTGLDIVVDIVLLVGDGWRIRATRIDGFLASDQAITGRGYHLAGKIVTVGECAKGDGWEHCTEDSFGASCFSCDNHVILSEEVRIVFSPDNAYMGVVRPNVLKALRAAWAIYRAS